MNTVEYFKHLNTVPHGSGNTKLISDLCVQFAKEHNYDYKQDDVNNVVIYVPATQGYETHEPVIIQGHMDMVCVKTPECTKDMSKEPIDIIDDGNILRADKTSLGGDDTIALAMAMALCGDESSKHPAMELVFTVDEETDMGGAKAFDANNLHSKRMLNLDSEVEGSFICGSAGSTLVIGAIPVKRESLGKVKYFNIAIDGLMGGHSGLEITKKRANAIRLLARVIYGVSMKYPVGVCEMYGGVVDNAIPVIAEAVIAVPEENADNAKRLAEKHEILFKAEFKEREPNLKVFVDEIEAPENYIDPVCCADTKKIMRHISSVPDGLRNCFEEFPEIAKTSSNLGICNLTKDGITYKSFVRSAVYEEREEVVELIKKMAEHDGGVIKIAGENPEWPYNRDSKIAAVAAEAYRELTGKEPELTVTHGGLETGIFASKIEDLDIVSIGPEIKEIHSPREEMEIASVNRTYELVKRILEKL